MMTVLRYIKEAENKKISGALSLMKLKPLCYLRGQQVTITGSFLQYRRAVKYFSL
jgi:hypothetical protein